MKLFSILQRNIHISQKICFCLQWRRIYCGSIRLALLRVMRTRGTIWGQISYKLGLWIISQIPDIVQIPDREIDNRQRGTPKWKIKLGGREKAFPSVSVFTTLFHTIYTKTQISKYKKCHLKSQHSIDSRVLSFWQMIDYQFYVPIYTT